MTSSKAKTVARYLADLPDDRRQEIEAVLKAMRRRMPKGYQEIMGHGMIMWGIPLKQYPDTYNGQPLCYAALAAQKNYFSLHLMSVYGDPQRLARLQEGFAKVGKKLDIGKACVRFRRAADLDLGVIGDLVAEVPPAAYIARYQKSRELTKAGKAGAASRTRRAAGSVKRIKP
jgi:hypothetical protein